MTKNAFLAQLRERLSGLPKDDLEERVSFYGEMIDDRMEAGLSEEQAVASVGSVDEIVPQIIGDIPLTKLAKEKAKPKRQMQTWEIILLILGSPIWFSLLIAAVSVTASLYAVLWAVIVSLWAVFASLVGSGFGAVAGGIILICTGHVPVGTALIGTGLLLAGLSIFMFFGCTGATKGIAILTKKIALWIKGCLIRKEEA